MAAASEFLPPSHHNIIFLMLSFLTGIAQSVGNSPPGPTIVECQPRLLPLAPCGPFVQGTVPLPPQQCCSNFRTLYNQQRSCLCLLLNGTTLRSLPINTTLAFHLPALCSVRVDTSACPAPLGTSQPMPLQPSTPQVTKSNSTAAGRTDKSPIPIHHSSGVNSKVNDYTMIMVFTCWILVFWI